MIKYSICGALLFHPAATGHVDSILPCQVLKVYGRQGQELSSHIGRQRVKIPLGV